MKPKHINRRKLFNSSLIFCSFLFLILFYINTVNAVQPQGGDFEKGMVIKYTSVEVLKINQNYPFIFHIYNRSDGIPMNSGISCFFHLTNSTGCHSLKMETSTPLEVFGYVFKVDGNNFTVPGEYSYVIQCNNSFQGGFDSVDFTVSTTGFLDTEWFFIIILLISVLIIGFGFLIRDGWVTILGTFGLYFIGVYILINGIVGVKDTITTYSIGIILLGLAAYISVKSGIELIE